jgi:hypothetical protein
MDMHEMVEMTRELARQKPFLKLASLFSPERVHGFSKIRVGSEYDGGYVMIDDFDAIDLALSFGVETNADWDLELANRGILVRQYDHSIERPPATHERLQFFRSKIISSPGDGEGASIASILSEVPPSRDASIILKIDIEGDEWPVFDACSVADLERFSQIVVEFHNFSLGRDPAWLNRATRVMEKLRAKFGVYHVHANNWSAMSAIGNVYFPDTLEVSFAHRGRYALEASSELFPTALDKANNPLCPDLYLGAFKFAQIGEA